MEEKNKGFLIFGKVIEKESAQGIPGLTVKAIDKDWLFDDLLGTAVTDENGQFSIRYEGEDFQELFFDNQPDIYLKIKDPDGGLLLSTKDKVRYQASTTEEFIVEIPKALLPPLPAINWNKEVSERLKKRIITDEKLMKGLSEAVNGVFKKHKLDLNKRSYIFEPRVFEFSPEFGPVVMKEARKSLWKLLFVEQYQGDYIFDDELGGSIQFRCLPACGPLDPRTLRILEAFRFNIFADEPIPVLHSGHLMQKIVGNKALLEDVSDAIFKVLEENKITFKANQGCVFTPMVFDPPAYAQQIGTVEHISDLKGFGPQIISDSNPLPAKVAGKALRLRANGVFDGNPMPPPGLADIGVVKAQFGNAVHLVPGLQIKGWWWVGIPAPEMLKAMDIIREYV